MSKKFSTTFRRRGEITVSILEQIAAQSPTAGDLLSALLPTPTLSIRQIEWRAKKIAWKRGQKEKAKSTKKVMEQRYRQILSKLKKAGAIEVSGDVHSYQYKLTTLGRLTLLRLRKEIAQKQIEPVLPYPFRKKKPRLVIVVFDIPEKERYKRAWLRKALSSIGLHLIQQSVWIGRVALPPEFLNDLKSLGLLQCVEILTVEYTGSFTRIK